MKILLVAVIVALLRGVATGADYAKVVDLPKAGAIVEAITGEVHSTRVRSKEGWEAWSNEAAHFGNKDACG
jgi:hypothetical protein